MIQVLQTKEVCGVVFQIRDDSRTARETVRLPRYDKSGTDLKSLGWRVNLVNAAGNTDIFVPTTVTVLTNCIEFEWNIYGVATAAAGRTTFQIVGINQTDTSHPVQWASKTASFAVGTLINATTTTSQEAAISALDRMILDVQQSLPNVQAATNAANSIATTLQTKLANGELNGTNGTNGTSATHSWNGSVLTITSASGTSSADLKGPRGETGATGERGAPGQAGRDGRDGSDASVTSANIASALGYTPASSTALDTLSGDVTALYTEVGGKIGGVKVAGTELTPDESGKVNVPVATADSAGVVKGTNAYGIAVGSEGSIKGIAKTASEYANAYDRLILSKGTLENVKCDIVKAAITDTGANYTDAEKTAACETIGAERKLADGWVLKGTLNDPANGITLDLSGCSELMIFGGNTGTGATQLVRDDGRGLIYGISRSGGRSHYARFADGLLGQECINCVFVNARSTEAGYTSRGDGYNHFDGRKISQITQIRLETPANVTSCSYAIYAR